MGCVIKMDGGTEVVELVQGVNGQLDQLQGIVGGFIEHVRLHNGDHMWVNEDGLRLGLELNPLASDIAKQPVVGNVIVTRPGEVQ